MRPWVNSTVLQFIDSIAICIAQGYMLTRARLASHPSPVLRRAICHDILNFCARVLASYSGVCPRFERGPVGRAWVSRCLNLPCESWP